MTPRAAISMPAFAMRPRALERGTVSPSWWRRVDVVLLGAALGIALSGLLMIYSATRHQQSLTQNVGFVARQALSLALGTVLMAVVAALDPGRLRGWAPVIYIVQLSALAVVLTPLGSSSKGAQAWFAVGGFQFQPSEYSKILLILCLAAFGARQATGLANRHVGVVAVLSALPIGLIMLQPDLGTALVFVAIVGAVLLVAGASGRALLALLALVVAIAVAVVALGILKQYQLDRLGAFLDPNSNTQRSAYNLNQSKIAIGSGGITGKGLFLGSQTNLRYVPEQHTDFIFTVVGEELGLLGSVTLLALYGVLLWRIWRTAREASDRFGALVCTGVLAMFVFQVFENVGMTMGIMPITGIPLPLVSYGGSSVLTSLAGLGLVLGIGLRSA